MNIYDICKAVTGNISKWLGKGVASTTRDVSLPEVIEHAGKIVDHLWNTDAADPQFWADACKHPHVYDSMVTLELWMDQQMNQLKQGTTILECFLRMAAFVAGFLFAILFFLPEILGYNC
jgi:hypothetical protein